MIEVTVAVNGQPTIVSPVGNESLGSMLSRAMLQTGNLQYGPLDRWEARSRIGDLLDQELTWDWNSRVLLKNDLTIFLNLKPGLAA